MSKRKGKRETTKWVKEENKKAELKGETEKEEKEVKGRRERNKGKINK